MQVVLGIIFFLKIVIVSYRYENIGQRASALFTCMDYYKTFRNVNGHLCGKLLLEKIIFLPVRRCFHIKTSFLNGNFCPWRRSHCFASKRREAVNQQISGLSQKSGILQTKLCQKYPLSFRQLTVSQMKPNAVLTLSSINSRPLHFYDLHSG